MLLLVLDFLSSEAKVGIAIGLVAVVVIGRIFYSKKATAVAQIPMSGAALKGKLPAAEGKRESEPLVFLNKENQQVPLIEKIELSHDTRLFRFGLPTPNTILGLPIGKHFKVLGPNRKPTVEGQWNGQPDPEAGKAEIQRSYTPTSSDDDRGHFDLIIKVYPGGVLPRFPDGGKMSQYFESLAIGDKITIKGPFGLIEYLGKGGFKIKSTTKKVKQVGMIAGGTGITPMLQIINAVLKDAKDETVLYLLFANQTEGDILVRDILESKQKEYPDRFKLWYTLDRPPEGWKYSTGFINAEMISSHLPPPGEDTLILMCGPPPMINYACNPNLDQLGYSKEDRAVF